MARARPPRAEARHSGTAPAPGAAPGIVCLVGAAEPLARA